MYAILRCGIATVYGWIRTWRAPYMGSSVVPQYGVLKKVHKNQLSILTYSQPLSPQGWVMFSPRKPIPPICLQWHVLIFPQSLVVNQHHPLQLHRELQQVDQSRLQSESTVHVIKKKAQMMLVFWTWFREGYTRFSIQLGTGEEKRDEVYWRRQEMNLS